jgi:steroid delta-isomerase-like uncharacterized protein
MSTEENKALVQRFYEEVLNKGNLGVIDELLSADVVDNSVAPGTVSGIEGAKQMIGMYRAAFPDIDVTIEDLIAEGDKVVSRYTLRGTQKGSFMGIAPTGKKITLTGIAVDRIFGGKCVEHWENFDQLGMMQQLGVIPPLG